MKRKHIHQLTILVPILALAYMSIILYSNYKQKQLQNIQLQFKKDILKLQIQHQHEIQESIKVDRSYMTYQN